ncbi:MAG: aldo/keto reductase [Chloroflexales bacterium]|nr:aldo/keto reductase [Chloroflexales bacterium]
MGEIAIDETLRALDDLIRAGKVRYIGTSTFAAWQLVEALWAAKELGLNRFVCEQPPYNLLDRRIERELLPMAQTFGIGIIPWSPLAKLARSAIAGGLLSGKYHRGDSTPADARYSTPDNPIMERRVRNKEPIFDVVEQLQPLAEANGCTLAQLALAWCAGQPGVSSAIIGPRTMEQLEDNLGALAVTLSDDDLAQIDAISPPGQMATPFYEASFGPSQHRW